MVPEHSFIEDNNDIALALVTVIPLMRYLQLATKHKWVKIGLGIAMSFVMPVGDCVVLTSRPAGLDYDRYFPADEKPAKAIVRHIYVSQYCADTADHATRMV